MKIEVNRALVAKKTKILLTTLLLGISISAACITAKEYLNPYYPQRIYGGAKLDSVVISSNPTWKTIVLFDDKGRMTINRSYSLDEETHQWKAEVEDGYGYADGMMYTSHYHRYLNLENSLAQVEGEFSKWKYDSIVYNEKGDPLRYIMYYWVEESNEWLEVYTYEFQYDDAGRAVLVRISAWDPRQQAITTTEYSFEYILDDNGRVIVQTSNYSMYGRTEYTYNDHGDILVENGGGATTQYIYNAYNNLEQRIYTTKVNATDTQTAYYTYYYSFPSTTEVGNAEVSAIPSENFSVILQWPAVEGADTYTLDIKKNGELVCSLIFNAQGQLTGINFAPARNGNARKTPTATQTTGGWQYQIEGLEANTAYFYTATAKKNGTVLSTQTVYFTTSLQDIENVLNADKPVKVQLNNQILILRGDKTYTLTGQEVK